MARRHVLIGSGPAAISAAETIRGQDADAQIVVLSAESHGYYSRPGLAYYLANEVPERALFPFSAADFARLGIELLHERAVRIDRAEHSVSTATGRTLPYDRLLIATGSRAIPAEVPGIDLDGVAKLDDMDDARELIRLGRHARAAVVVGGGITALEIAEGLAAHHVHVHYLVRKDRYWSNVLSEAESRLVAQGLVDSGVEIHYFTELARLLGENGRVVGVVTDSGHVISCDVVGVAIGVLPIKHLAVDAGLECDRGVIVDEYLRSSDPHIFAAGDVAEVGDPATGRRTVEVLWNSAVQKGRVAGTNMVAEPVRAYLAAAPLNVTRLAGLKTTIIGTVGTGHDSDVKGVSRGDSETWRQLGDAAIMEAQIGDAHVRLALRDRRIVGAVVMGDQALSFPLQELIAQSIDIGEMAAALQAPDAPVAQLLDGLWRERRASRA